MPELAPTPGQTIGPFFGYSLPYPGGGDLVPVSHPAAVRIHGRVLDGAGAPVPDAVVELWQAGPDGAVSRDAGSLVRDGWTFTGWGRCATDALGHYSFRTLMPGAPAGRVPFVALTILARGLLDRLFTRAYLVDEEQGQATASAAEPLLAAVAPERRSSLLARRDGDGFAFDIVLQGAGETVFLEHVRGT